MCFYPPDIATDDTLPKHLAGMLDKNGMMLFTVFFEHVQVSRLTYFRSHNDNDREEDFAYIAKVQGIGAHPCLALRAGNS